MHGALFFLGFTLLAWGAAARLLFLRSLFLAIKTYFWTTFFIAILLLFQHAQILGAMELLLLIPGFAFLILTRDRFPWPEITYQRPGWTRLFAAGCLFLLLLGSAIFFCLRLTLLRGDLVLPFAAGLILIILALTGITARGEWPLIFFFLSLLFQGAALSLTALTRPGAPWEAQALACLLLLAGPILLGSGACFLLCAERAQPGSSRTTLSSLKF